MPLIVLTSARGRRPLMVDGRAPHGWDNTRTTTVGLCAHPARPAHAAANSPIVPFNSCLSFPILTALKRSQEGEDNVHAHARRRIATLLLPVGALIMSFIGAGLSSGPAAATGILPPSNPSANIPPDSGDWLSAINNARAQEGVGPMNVSQTTLGTLPVDQQVFTVINDERVDRGLPPIDYVTSQLDSYAQSGADSGTDPSFPSSVTGGGAADLRRLHLGRRPDLGPRGRLLLDVRRRLERLLDHQRRLQSLDPIGVLGTPRHHLALVPQLPLRRADLSMGAAFSADRFTGRVPRRHSRELVLASHRRHGVAGAGRIRVVSGSPTGRHRPLDQRLRVLGGPGRTAPSPPSARRRTTAR